MPATFLNDERLEKGLVPLVIGVTGHRDLVAGEEPRIREVVRDFFIFLRERFPDRPLELLSPLAEGADSLVAEVALELGVELVVPLPMARASYIEDFESARSRARFENLCSRARAVFELPIVSGAGAGEDPADRRNLQYAQLGVFLCAHSHVLLALWDGKHSEDVGGTAQVVRFHQDDVMSGFEKPLDLRPQLLVDDDSDLIYHVVVSRDRENGTAADGLEPTSGSWLTTDEDSPRTPDLPEKYERVFRRTSRFNAEARRFRQRITDECYPLIERDEQDALPPEAWRINEYFCVADWLAIHYQRRNHMALRVTHSLAFVMGMTFLLYSDFEARRVFMLVFLVCFVVALAVHTVASRSRWHSNYLEYRALAEGLRVQFYWAVAGVTSGAVTKYLHDNFLQKQDSELSWIQNVMRVSGMMADVSPNLEPQGLAYVLRAWIGSSRFGGQLKYYRAKASQYVLRRTQLESLAKLMAVLVSGVTVASVLVSDNTVRSLLFLALGALLLVYSVRQSYAHRVAEKDLIKQYDFMYSIFRNARKRLHAAIDDMERRRILRVLGESALDEHAEWIFLHRERPPDPGGIWRMES